MDEPQLRRSQQPHHKPISNSNSWDSSHSTAHLDLRRVRVLQRRGLVKSKASWRVRRWKVPKSVESSSTMKIEAKIIT
ncbi:hypothetical protein pipiens_000594, partial [Culex pipiens pipiens]